MTTEFPSQENKDRFAELREKLQKSLVSLRDNLDVLSVIEPQIETLAAEISGPYDAKIPQLEDLLGQNSIQLGHALFPQHIMSKLSELLTTDEWRESFMESSKHNERMEALVEEIFDEIPEVKQEIDTNPKWANVVQILQKPFSEQSAVEKLQVRIAQVQAQIDLIDKM